MPAGRSVAAAWPAWLGLGSNLGDRAAHVAAALDALACHEGVRVVRVSALYETSPVGGPPQGWFLNAAAELETSLPPRALLAACLAVEQQLGRVRAERDGPRTIDLDVLLYADRVVVEPELVVPHPALHQRAFVLEPLVEIAPDVRHPLLGRSVRDLAEGMRRGVPATAGDVVRRWEPPA